MRHLSHRYYMITDRDGLHRDSTDDLHVARSSAERHDGLVLLCDASFAMLRSSTFGQLPLSDVPCEMAVQHLGAPELIRVSVLA